MPQTAPIGILLVDKDGGITSHDVVARVRRALGTRKVGHAGTLDPMATGLLVVGVGPATKLLTFFVGLDKEYTATIRLGSSTSTDDADGEVVDVATASQIEAVDRSSIEAVIITLTGDIMQRPSAVSAIKVDGRRAYERVRAGEDVELPARSVTIEAFEVLHLRRDGEAIDLDVRVVCTSGTYIRALARDLGAALQVGGHLTALRRTRVGPFSVADAVAVESYERDAPADAAVMARLIAPAAAIGLQYPVVQVDDASARDLTDGKRIAVDAIDGTDIAVVSPDGRLIGLAAVSGGRARVIMNLPSDAAPKPTSTPTAGEIAE